MTYKFFNLRIIFLCEVKTKKTLHYIIKIKIFFLLFYLINFINRDIKYSIIFIISTVIFKKLIILGPPFTILKSSSNFYFIFLINHIHD